MQIEMAPMDDKQLLEEVNDDNNNNSIIVDNPEEHWEKENISENVDEHVESLLESTEKMLTEASNSISTIEGYERSSEQSLAVLHEIQNRTNRIRRTSPKIDRLDSGNSMASGHKNDIELTPRKDDRSIDENRKPPVPGASCGNKNENGEQGNIPLPFKRAFVWPENLKKKKKKKNEKIPTVATSDEWQKYHLMKEEEKLQKQRDIEEREMKRQEAQLRKKQEKERKKVLAEEKKKIKEQMNKLLAEKKELQKQTEPKKKA